MEDEEAEIPDITGVLIVSQWILSDKSLCPYLPCDQCALFGMTSRWPAQDGREVAKILQEQLRHLPSGRKRAVCIASGLLTLGSYTPSLQLEFSVWTWKILWWCPKILGHNLSTTSSMGRNGYIHWRVRDQQRWSLIRTWTGPFQLQAMSKPAMLTPPPFLTNAEYLSLSIIIINNN